MSGHRVSSLAERSRRAIADPDLQESLGVLTWALRFMAATVRRDPQMQDLRRRAAEIRRETLADLDGWLDRLDARLTANGATVHRAGTPEEACEVILGIAQREGIELVAKSKSMATEEIELNEALREAGIEAVETDLGEFLVQVAGQRPSHIVGPALHMTLRQITDVLSRTAGRPLPDDPEVLCAFAREHLRERFLTAGMGVTGANFVAADTGTIVLVTNEGNGRMCTSLPRVHVCVMPVEKVIPRLSDAGVLVPVLTGAATGQRLTTYVSMITGPRREGDVDGPEQLHVVFLDHRRLSLVGTRYEEILACIRCGACLNVCPVYGKIGGHAYDSVYSGPMGAVLTPLLSAGETGRDLAEASSLCGACTEACPVGIPLADMLVHLRADARRAPSAAWPAAGPPRHRRLRGLGFRAWAGLWRSSSGYRASAAAARAGGRAWARVRRRDADWVPSAPLMRGWTEARDLPVPARRSFRATWAARQRGEERW